jgi:hypothetical protein
MAVRLSALRTNRTLLPRYIIFRVSGAHNVNFCYRLSEPQGLVRPEGLDKPKKLIHLIGSRNRDFSAFSTMCYVRLWTLYLSEECH